MLEGKNIVLGICGSIAGYKSASLVRLLVKAGANALVIGTFLEKGGSVKKLAEIAKAIQRSK